MSINLPNLNYSKSALAPYISEETLEFHYGKHHQAYVDNGNKLLAGSDLASLDIKDIIVKTAGDSSKAGIFNNAAQVWNHSFYWDSMTPNGGGAPTGKILDKINQDFGSYENFKNAFVTAGATQFGSGWAWLIVNAEGKLEVTKTANADNPLTKGQTPLATMDVWEHAYYIDYRNARPKYMETFLSNLINWDFANANLAKA
ncbi:MAG: superoxide dismutase [Rickettsiales bacterium]|jgi:superoxide dismutase, Fe-Mn family|nr:superoxide dismutase [Rickettsiales bacterium]